MTRKIILRPEAQIDIDSIWDYTADQWDMDQADNYVGDIRATIHIFGEHPMIGRKCFDLAEGLRRFGTGSHIIFYLHDDDLIDIVRILHERMDATKRL